MSCNFAKFTCSVQSFDHVRLFVTPWTAARQASLSLTIFQSLLKLTSIESLMPSNHLSLCCPLLPPSVFPTIGVFSDESLLCIRWPKYWSFNFNILSKNIESFQRIFRTDFLLDGLVGSPCSPRDSQESSPLFCFLDIWITVFHQSGLFGGISSNMILVLYFLSYWYSRLVCVVLRAGPFSPRLLSFIFSLHGVRLHTLHSRPQLCKSCQPASTVETP